MSTPVPAPAEPRGGNVLTQRLGPFATWVWLLFATIAILAYAFLGKKKTAAQQAQATAGQSVAAQQVPDIIIQNQEGNETEPAPQPGTVPPSAPTPPTGPSIPPVRPPVRPPVSSGGGTGPKKPPAYRIVQVARWNDENPPWNSTLYGIAQHYGVKGGWQTLAKLNGVTNPKMLRVGQKIRVPA